MIEFDPKPSLSKDRALELIAKLAERSATEMKRFEALRTYFFEEVRDATEIHDTDASDVTLAFYQLKSQFDGFTQAVRRRNETEFSLLSKRITEITE